MKFSLDDLDLVYKSYGFDIDKSHESVRVYLYKKSRYYGAEIVPLWDVDTINQIAEELKHQYSTLGYATIIRGIKSIEDADLELFKSFFAYDITRHRLKRKYNAFIDKQTRNLIGNKYEYIESPFEILDNHYGDIELFSLIETVFNKQSSDLIIIEASAGYGKTCTAYEVLSLLSDRIVNKTPIFTELARNRGANIFRYILLDEIDTEYPSLDSSLVIKEIKKGRIPLIIDGFDELLYKVELNDSDSDSSFEEVETMLDTIGNLLEGNSKVILTTRRTAIFNGQEFTKWFDKWNDKFNVTRISIKEPRIKDWLGEEKFKKIKENAVPIQYIANPVILTFLKNIDYPGFEELIENPEMLIKQYFDQMLERERERQNLIITPDRQYEIFRNVVKLLLEFDITVESKEFFKEIIKEQNSKLLEYTRTLYTGTDKPSMDNLLDTLATHALLDRKGRDENNIGFINDFVLGIFIGDIICEAPTDIIRNVYSIYMIELAVTAYKVHSIKHKISLWGRLMMVKERFQPLYLFYFDVFLREKLMDNYEELSVYDLNFYNMNFGGNTIKNSAFLNCLFKRCTFNLSDLSGVSFFDCVFDSCIIVNDSEYIDTFEGISVVKCRQDNCNILYRESTSFAPEEKNLSPIEIQVLYNLMQITHTKGHHIMQVTHRFDKTQYRKVSQALTLLEASDLISIRGNHIYLNINRIHEIKKIVA